MTYRRKQPVIDLKSQSKWYFFIFRKRVNEIEKIEEENKKLKKELKNTKIRLRSTSKDNKLLDMSWGKNSFANKYIGILENKNNCLSRGRSQTDLNFGINHKFDQINIDKYKTKIQILQCTNDNVVKENALLRLKRKNLYFIINGL